MKLLITGFGAFPGVPINATEQLVGAWMRHKPDWSFDNRLFDDMKFEVLPTSYDVAGSRISGLISDYQPDHVLLLGVATTQSTIRLERFALNIDDSPVPDEAGILRRGDIMAADGPHAMKTTIDLNRLQGALIQEGVNVEISNHAGTYVCNHTYYSALLAASRLHKRCNVLFVHVPGIHKLLTDDEHTATTHLIGRAVSTLVNCLANV